MFEPRIQEQGEKDKVAWLAQQARMQAQKTGGKRAAGEGVRETPTAKRKKEVEGNQVEVLMLEDSEEEREDAVGVNSSEQSQAGHQTILPLINSTQTQTPAALARLKSLPITVVGEVALSGTDSDEDDIQVRILQQHGP